MTHLWRACWQSEQKKTTRAWRPDRLALIVEPQRGQGLPWRPWTRLRNRASVPCSSIAFARLTSCLSCVVADVADRCPRVDAAVEERLAPVDVADARDHGLVEEDLADRLVRWGGDSGAADDLVDVEARREDVGPEPAERRMGTLVVVPDELDHRSVEAHGDAFAAFDDGPGLERRPPPPHALRGRRATSPSSACACGGCGPTRTA